MSEKQEGPSGAPPTRRTLTPLERAESGDPKYAGVSTEPEIKSKAIVKGTVKRRKKKAGSFISGEVRDVGSFVFTDVFLPAAKELVTDLVIEAVERLVYGESRSKSRKRSGGSFSRVSYGRYFEEPYTPKGRPHRPAAAGIGADEILLEFREDAVEVLTQLRASCEQYGYVTLAGYYELVGAPTRHTDFAYGWTDLSRAGVLRVRGGYIVDLPNPRQID
jgi:hypothetical protein